MSQLDLDSDRQESGLLSNTDLDRLSTMLKPLSNPVRLRLLRFLIMPHYLEEIANHLGLTRQAARKHVDQLLSIGAVKNQNGKRDSGPVIEYVTSPQALFVIHDRFERLGSLNPLLKAELPTRTAVQHGNRVENIAIQGPVLFVMRGMDSGKRHDLDPHLDTWTIGRSVDCQIPISHDPWVSNRHAELQREGKVVLLTDLRSTNSTQHNWSLLPRGSEVELKHGDVVGVGRTLLLYWSR